MYRMDATRRCGSEKTLTSRRNRLSFKGHMWIDGGYCHFHLDDSPIKVRVAQSTGRLPQNANEDLDARLFEAVHKERQKLIAAKRKENAQRHVPKSAGDMTVLCTTPEGRIKYRWE